VLPSKKKEQKEQKSNLFESLRNATEYQAVDKSSKREISTSNITLEDKHAFSMLHFRTID